ncbi:MAG: YhbY family RNA-binding protein [Pedosphaera sp.]|nr:YhbY family RNA-binding protein [Pedosphaera sp.]
MNETVPISPPLSGAEIRKLKSRAQRIEAVTRLGKGGISPAFLTGLNRELELHELVKVRLFEMKDQRYEVADRLAQETGSTLVTVIGHVVVLFRASAPKPSVTE